MASCNNPSQPANTPPPKPWERIGASSDPSPFKPPSSGSTSEIVEASRSAKSGESVDIATRNTFVNRNIVSRPIPSRPWEQNNRSNYGGYDSGMYNSYGGVGGPYGGGLFGNRGYVSGMYNSYGGLGGPYGGGLFGNSMHSGFGGPYCGSGLYGNNMYGSGFDGPISGPYSNQNPNSPFGAPPSPPGFWKSFLYVMHGVVNCIGRISVLIDQNAQAFHMFMSAMLQLFDRSGLLYGELARFVLRLLGIRIKPRKHWKLGPGHDAHEHDKIEGLRAASASWDSVWGANGGGKGM